MGKTVKSSVGRSVLKARNKGGRSGKGKESWLHTSELHDGEDWGRLNMQSVTEQSALDEFLATAELAGTEFIAEKLNVSVVTANNLGGLPSLKEEQRIQQVQDDNKTLLQIPRRPSWDKTTTAEQLEQHERESFLTWRRALAELQEQDDIILTPYERNLEFWRQLWRVIERSDVIMQIVDARNPLLFRCEDLESYVCEVNSSKVNVLLVNKADLLTQEQRETWADFFKSINVKAVFWSAVVETERLQQQKTMEQSSEQEIEHLCNSTGDVAAGVLPEQHVTKFLDLSEETNLDDSEGEEKFSNLNISETETGKTEDTSFDCGAEELNFREDESVVSYTKECPLREENSNERQTVCSSDDVATHLANDRLFELQNSKDKSTTFNSTSCTLSNDKKTDSFSSTVGMENETSGINDKDVVRIAGKAVNFYTSGHLLTGEELLAYCQWLHQEHVEETKHDPGALTCTVVGLVGYPNVGKSSTINAILQAKKVPVSATPGRTKHFQTLFVDKNICLCDCPGLVFPSFVTTKAEMVVSGILPIDQMRDHIAPVSLICRRIPRTVLENVYGLNLPPPQEGEDPCREPYAEELLNAYGYNKGYMTSQGRPDCPRSARYILKDYVNGKLLFCHAPPLHNPKTFQISFSVDTKPVRKVPATNKKILNKLDVLEKDFFKQRDSKTFISATTGTEEYKRWMTAKAHSDSSRVLVGKPWKKHGNRNKREKIRRLQQQDY